MAETTTCADCQQAVTVTVKLIDGRSVCLDCQNKQGLPDQHGRLSIVQQGQMRRGVVLPTERPRQG